MPNILVIDDDQSFRGTLARVLRVHGFQTLQADNGRTGIELALAHLPDLIICDVNMPGWDGYAVLEALRRDPATAAIPLILMTGEAHPEGMRRGMEKGADDYLAKPFAMEALLAAVGARLKKRQAELEREEQTKARLVEILEVTPELVGIVDARTQHLLYLNSAGRTMLGIPAQEDVSRLRLGDLYAPPSFQLIEQEGIPTAVREGVWTGETALLRTDRQEIPVSQLLLAHKTPAGAVDYLSTIVRDISERKRAEQERLQIEMQLRQAQKLESIGQLAAGIAHEINTPTQYIGDNIRFIQNSFTELRALLQELEKLLAAARSGQSTVAQMAQLEAVFANADIPYLLAEMPHAIDESLQGVERVAKIVRAMKDFSHPGSSERTPLDLNQAIESTVTVARNEWKYVADVVTHFDASLPRVPVFPGEFNQVILNVVVNAAHAIADVVGDGTEGKGTITITTRTDQDWVEIRVHDTGTGIPEAARHRIFDPFFTTKAPGKGTGQGLAISRSVVVDQHGGDLRFETELGRGTTFIIRLPLRPPPAAA